MKTTTTSDDNDEPPSGNTISINLEQTKCIKNSSIVENKFSSQIVHGKNHSDQPILSHESPDYYSRSFNLNKFRSIKKLKPNFIISPRVRQFRRNFYPTVTDTQWNDWAWQLRNRIKDFTKLKQLIQLSSDEMNAILHHQNPLPFSITPYYASLLDPIDNDQALRRTVISSTNEYQTNPSESIDPLSEEEDSPVPGIVHRYPDRVLFLVTGYCAVYCRYCTRSRIVGDVKKMHHLSPLYWENAINYIKHHTEVRDVLLSGGDPLTISDNKLEWLIMQLRQIPHVEIIRIGTKIPVVLPQRITKPLVAMLRKYHPLWMSIHFTHPDELTPEVAEACNRLADAGIPLGSQTVLLKGINDTVETMMRLNHGLMKMRVKPYYLYQCDPVRGTSHFRTTVDKGLEIMAGLRGFTSGYAVPTFVVDAPGGGGKIPLLPDYILGREKENLLLRNYEGKIHSYPDPGGTTGGKDHVCYVGDQ